MKKTDSFFYSIFHNNISIQTISNFNYFKILIRNFYILNFLKIRHIRVTCCRVFFKRWFFVTISQLLFHPTVRVIMLVAQRCIQNPVKHRRWSFLRKQSTAFSCTSLCFINPLTTIVPHHIETSQLICAVNQLPGFYTMGNIGLNGLKKTLISS